MEFPCSLRKIGPPTDGDRRFADSAADRRGSDMVVRRLYTGVVQSIALYGVLVWCYAAALRLRSARLRLEQFAGTAQYRSRWRACLPRRLPGTWKRRRSLLITRGVATSAPWGNRGPAPQKSERGSCNLGVVSPLGGPRLRATDRRGDSLGSRTG